MLNSIHQVLDSLGISPQKRAIHIQFTSPILNDQVFLQRIDGVHALNDGLKAELLCLSTNATIQLKSFIGVQAAIDIVTERGELTRVTGIITQAQQGQSDGSLTLYKLTLEDPTALWKYRRNSRVFMNKSVVEIWEILFKEWQTKNPLFAASLSLDLSGLTQTYDVRPFVMQHNESDWNFLTRLLRSENISWLIDEAQHIVPSTDTSIQAQKLRLIDANSQYQPLDRKTIRYHRSSAVEQYDSMTRLTAERSLQPNVMHIQRWQAEILEQEEGIGSVQSKHQHSEQYDNATLGLEQAWNYAPAWIGDLKGEDGVTKSGNQQVERLNQNLHNYYEAQAKRFIAQTTVRDAYVGYYFELNEHPEIDQHESSDKSFLIISKSFFNQNNLPKDLNDQINGLLAQSNWAIQPPENSDERQANQLILQRRHIPTTPAYNPQIHSPVTHPQRAKVVGPEGEEIYVDEWGRIKVRFLFTRSDDHSHDGGAGTNNNDTDSAWIDVLTPWAGEGYGARFLPRIGEIVVIDFFNGDIDRPFVMGRIHEAQRHPTKFDNKGKLPDTKKLSGIRSKEVSGGGFGQLRFDDTPGQISTQLQSSHGASQLNLGKLSHPKDKAESENRGEGFELRTDAWGAVRAGKGLLISAASQNNASDIQLNIQELLMQLKESLDQLKTLENNARTSKVFQDENYQISQGLLTQVESTLEKFEESNILVSAPKDFISVSQQNQTHVAKENIKMMAGKQFDLSSSGELTAHAAKGLSFYTQEKGINAFATQGNIKIHAQNDELDLASLKDCKIMSTENAITIAAKKEIMLTCGGGYIKIKTDGSIEINSPGLVEVKSSQTKFLKGSNHNFQLPNISSKICIPCLLDAARKSLPFVHREI
ncbi:TPA: type VI secretion system Vgr family protein [Acinetobacter baumannii]|uniref:type VI secretion system Vgr family protein n=1 Tax=Acinetobacter baumannii TaxID=470 RepID=UPI00135F6297|nr:type VI secretion system Vgr family protein [Acinetobacter baumannii]MDC5350922.1 type VI secretion system tip protein VgrG [Acinetobacter baumannii]CAA0235507.1 type VI secretion system tip protein VgrG [Acinetobacter baumannii]